jgi:VIT1/CCC1 family predicted Fe2+/Mn2+ transporter
MDAALIERGLALIAGVVVGVTAFFQLKDELTVHGLDAAVTKVLLGLMAVGCILAVLAAVHVLGVRPS